MYKPIDKMVKKSKFVVLDLNFYDLFGREKTPS